MIAAHRTWPALLLALVTLTGCSSQQMFRGIYEGTQVRDQLSTTPAEKVSKPEPLPYDQYETERNRTNAR
jgi:hypothetical protein